MGIYEELQERGLIAQVTDNKGAYKRRRGKILYRLRSYGGFASCGAFHGSLPYEAAAACRE